MRKLARNEYCSTLSCDMKINRYRSFIRLLGIPDGLKFTVHRARNFGDHTLSLFRYKSAIRAMFDVRNDGCANKRVKQIVFLAQRDRMTGSIKNFLRLVGVIKCLAAILLSSKIFPSLHSVAVRCCT